MSSFPMAAPEKAGIKYLKLSLLFVAAVVVLAGGFVFLKEYKDSKLLLILFAVVWGVGSTILLYTVLNAVAETFPRKVRTWVLPLVFAGPALVLLVWFLVLPTVRTLGLSFFDETSTKFVGLDNYFYAFTNPTMLESFGNNLLWLFFGTAGTVVLGLLIAVLADRSPWEAGFKALIFLPMAISFVGAGVIWKFIYAYKGEGIADIGLLNAVVVAFGGTSQAWLQLPIWNNFLLIVIMIWLQTGYAMVILSSAIKNIPEEHLEAARIDGASEFQIFFRIIIPSILGSIITVTTTIVIFSLKLFDIVRVMTGGNFGTNVVANQFYVEQFTFGSTGHASAIAIVLLVAIVPVLIYNLRQFAERKAFA
ncbi:MAG: sugar ABC transporter permease [Spirochaetales bacterium]